VAAGGEAGVAKVLDLLQTDISRVLGQLGLRSLAELGPGVLRGPELA
jgi:isopentenyl diphosphate isomerase/L-lactate dehydrogenase-like FMN-dependent dehydrogenase